MAVLDQSYQPWQGELEPRYRRIAAMVRVGIRQAFSGTTTKIVILSTYAFMFGWMGLLFIIASTPVPLPIAAGNDIYRRYLGDMLPMGVLVMTLAALVGARSICRDLRNNAVAMYFSKALTRTDYLIGKLAIVVLFLLSATYLPAVILWIGQWAMSRDTLSSAQRFADLSAITFHSLVLVVPTSVYVVALSSLSRNAVVPGILWVMTYFGSRAVSEILRGAVREEWCKLLSWDLVVARLGELAYEPRYVRNTVAGKFFDPAPPAMSYGWEAPAAIVAGIVAVSLALVLWRLRKFETQE